MNSVMNNKCTIVTLWSPVAGVGTSFTALNMAKGIGDRGAKVALVDYDLKTPSLHIYLDSKDCVHCLDNVIPFTAGGSLSADIVENNIQNIDNFDFLRGTGSPDKAQYVAIESLTSILDVMNGMYDYIIIDTHNIIDNAGTYVALESANKVFIVTEKNVFTIQHFEEVRGLITENFNMNKFGLIINKDDREIFMEKEDIEAFYNIDDSVKISMLGADFLNSVNQGKWLSYLNSGDKVAKAYVESVQALIEQKVCPELEGIGQKKKSKFSLFKKR